MNLHRRNFSTHAKQWRRHRVPVALLIVLPCAWFWPLLAGFLPDFMDTVAYLYPMRMAVARQIREGTLPLWMPNIFSGAPLAANPQVAAWYPPQLLFYALPGAWSYGVLCVLHYVWGGLGVYACSYYFTRRRAASLFAALTFQFSSMLVSRLALAPHLYTSVWIPWMLLALELLLRRRAHRAPAMAALAGCVAMQLLAGSPQISYYTAIALAVYALVRLTQLRRRAWRGLLAAAFAGVVGIAIAAIQIVPMLELSSLVRRGEINLQRLQDQALNAQFAWRALVGFTGPTIEDTDSINAIGVGALLLCAVALFSRRFQSRSWALVAVGVVAWLLSLAVLVAVWFDAVPMYSRFHAPRRALVLWSVVGPVCAGLGAATLQRWFARRGFPKWSYGATLVVLSFGTVWMLPRLEREFTKPQQLEPLESYRKIIGDDRFLAIDPTFNYSYNSRRPDYGQSLMPNVAALGNLNDVQGYDPLVLERYAMARDWASERSGVFFPSHGAFFTDPNSPVLKLLAVQYLVGRFDLYDPGQLIPGRSIDVAATSASVELVHSHPGWPVYRYRELRPFAWTVANVLLTHTEDEALLGAAVDPYSTAYIRGARRGQSPQPFMQSLLPEKVVAEYIDARTIRIGFREPRKAIQANQFVCVAVTYAPGWSAVNEHPHQATVLATNGVILGVRVPKALQSVDLRYTPRYFWHSVVISAFGIYLLVRLLFGKPMRRRNGEVR